MRARWLLAAAFGALLLALAATWFGMTVTNVLALIGA